jgi:hypothetical protein
VTALGEYDPSFGQEMPTDQRVWDAVASVEKQYGEYSTKNALDALNKAQVQGEQETLPGQKNFDQDAPYGRDGKGRPYSLPPGRERTIEEADAVRSKAREIRKKQAEFDLAEKKKRDDRLIKRMEELEALKQRHMKEAEVARAWNDKVRAKRGLPPLGDSTAPGAPAGAAPQTGAPGMPPPSSRAPAAPARPSQRGPIGAPSVSSVGQTPPMTPVRTLEGDFRRQVIGGKDNAVPLVELTDQGSFVPNPNALNFDEFSSAYTVQDASSTADMIRMSNDPQAKREQQTIDQNRRSIASNDKLDPDQKRQALQQLNERQSQLHYGFLQAQGVGAGVRAGFGSISPNAPLMDQVYKVMGELEKQYPNSTAEQRYQLAMQMAQQAGSISRADGSIPAEVKLMDELGQQEDVRQQIDLQTQKDEATIKTVLDLQARGWDPDDAEMMAFAIAHNDKNMATEAMTKSSERKMLQAFVQARAPISPSEIEKQIMTQVLGADAVYSANAQRYSLMARARGGDKKAQEALGLYEGTPEWDAAFGDGGSFDKLNKDIRSTINNAVNDEKNRKKAEAQLREARGGQKLYDINQPETQMAIVSVFQSVSESNGPEINNAVDKAFPDLDASTKNAIVGYIHAAKNNWKGVTYERQENVDAFNRIVPIINKRLGRWGIPEFKFKATLKKGSAK